MNHPQQNISNVSSSFVFIPQQAAHSSSSVCDTLRSWQDVSLWYRKISIMYPEKMLACYGTCFEKHYVSPLSGFFAKNFAALAFNMPMMCFIHSDKMIINDHVYSFQSFILWLFSSDAVIMGVKHIICHSFGLFTHMSTIHNTIHILQQSIFCQHIRAGSVTNGQFCSSSVTIQSKFPSCFNFLALCCGLILTF